MSSIREIVAMALAVLSVVIVPVGLLATFAGFSGGLVDAESSVNVWAGGIIGLLSLIPPGLCVLLCLMARRP